MSIKPSTATCLAVIQAGFCGKELIETYGKLVLRILAKGDSPYLKIPKLCYDFRIEYGFYIPDFPMQSIIHSLIRSRWVVHEETTKEFRFDKSRKDIKKIVDEIDSDIARLDKCIDSIYQSYIGFVSGEFSVSYSVSDAAEHFEKFFGIGRRVREDNDASCQAPIYLAKFVEHCQDQEKEIFEFLNNLNMGLMLVDNITFSEEKTSESLFTGTRCFLDTNTILHLLGIDTIDRTAVYEKLMEDAKQAGLQLRVFSHTKQEIIRLFEGAMTYIDSINYNPGLATDAARYFRENGFKRERIQRFCMSIGQVLNKYDITEDNIYIKHGEYNGAEDEVGIRNCIVDMYKRNNSSFDPEKKPMTLEDDVVSIMKIYQLRDGVRAENIYHTNSFLLTSNRALVRAAEHYEQRHGNGFAASVFDEYLGTLLWYNNPVEMTNLSKVKLASRINAVFKPGPEFYTKMMEILHGIALNEEMNPDAVYLLKSERAIRRYIEITYGDAQVFSQKTVMEVYDEIRNDGAQDVKQKLSVSVPGKTNKLQMLTRELTHVEIDFADQEARLNKLREELATVIPLYDQFRSRFVQKANSIGSSINYILPFLLLVTAFLTYQYKPGRVILIIILALLLMTLVANILSTQPRKAVLKNNKLIEVESSSLYYRFITTLYNIKCNRRFPRKPIEIERNISELSLELSKNQSRIADLNEKLEEIQTSLLTI